MSDTTSRDADGAAPDAPAVFLSYDHEAERPLSDEAGRRFARIATAVLLVVGLCLSLGAAWAAFDEIRFDARAERAEGIVTTFRRDASGGSAPVFRFTTPDGRLILAETHLYSTPPAWRIGERATLRYDPADPAHASPATFFSRWFATLLLSILAAADLAAAWAVRRFLMR